MPGKELARGYTTGTCAQAAARAALKLLFGGKGAEVPGNVTVELPGGSHLTLPVEDTDVRWPEEGGRLPLQVSCAVRKDSGDDPDVTNGILIYTTVRRTGNTGIVLEGGAGVGRVTRPGLEQPVGSPAINQVPRRMIRDGVLEMCEQYGYSGNIKVTVSVPGGEETAKKTFNPRLGIEGGLSILGTTGIVEPMSEKALTDTIYLEMKMIRESGSLRCFVTPGNYGSDFLQEELSADPRLCVKCSNYVGEAIDFGKLLGMKGILLVGHMGKFIKLAAGVMNTHSRQADCRMEVLASHAALAGAGQKTVERIMNCINTSEAAAVLRGEGLLQPVLRTVMERMEFYLRQRAGGELEVEAVMFSLEDQIRAETSGAGQLLQKITEGETQI